MASPPRVHALLLCDGIVVDPSSRELTLVGVFRDASSQAFPASQPPFTAYCQMTGLNGSYDFETEIVPEDLQGSLGRYGIGDRFQSDDPLARAEAWVEVRDVVWPSAGCYVVRLLYNGRIADETTLLVEERP